jgi:hypothetical protein
VLEARVHLDAAGTHRALGHWPLLPSLSQLEARRTELDERFASAPPDQRDLIARLRDGNQLTLADTTEALNTALDAQGARREWILANWPHVVEYAEITRAIETRSYGPDLDDLRENLRPRSWRTSALSSATCLRRPGPPPRRLDRVSYTRGRGRAGRCRSESVVTESG